MDVLPPSATRTAPLSKDAVRRLLRAAWLGNVPAAAFDDAAACVRQKFLQDGELLFARGDRGDGIYIVASGAVCFSRATRDGRASIIALLEPSSWFGELSTFDKQPRTHDAHAVGATVLLHHGQGDFERLLARHPVLYANFVRLLSLRMRQAYDWLEEASVLSFPARLARRLLMLARSDGRVPLTQEQLGQLLGRTRQSIARQIALWSEDALISAHYGEIVILDRAGLAAVAEER